MAKYVMTTDDSIGGKLLGNGKVLVAKVIEGRNVVEIIEETSDIIDKVAPVLQHIINTLRDFFQNIFQRFPSVIVENGQNYIFTLQPSLGKGIDKAFYMSAIDPESRIYEFEGERMGKVKNDLYKALKATGYVG